MINIKRCLILALLIATIFQTSAQHSHEFAPSSALSEGRWVKIALDGRSDGIYQITYAQLRKLGFTTIDNVSIYGFGGHMLDESFSTGHIDDLPELAVYHDTKNERILFFANGTITWTFDQDKGWNHRQNPYSDKAYYFVHEKSSPARSLESIASATDFDLTVNTSDAYLLHEAELINIGKSGRELYGESFAYNQNQNFTFKEKLNAGAVKLTANFVANAKTQSSVTLKNGESTIGVANLRATINEYTFVTETNIADTFELKTADIPTIKVLFNSSTTVKAAHLNYIQLEGEQDIAPDSDCSYRLFRNKKSIDSRLKYTFDKSNHEVMIWDTTDPLAVKIQETEGDSAFIANEKGLRSYSILDANGKNYPGVTVIGEIGNQDLHAMKGIDMVIVSPIGMKKQAQDLADFRHSHDGLNVVVVTPEQIFNEYSSGTPDATAIRLFMKQLFGTHAGNEAKKEGYLLLFGDGHYNNRKIDAASNYLISYETENSLVETSSTVCDDYFGFLDDNEGGKKDYYGRYDISSDVVDIGIGRIPVHTVAEAEAVVKKIKEYSSNYHYGSWKNALCFLSDDDKISESATDAPNAHMKHNDQIVQLLQDTQGHKEYLYSKIYLPAYTQTNTASGTDYPDARKQFMETLQQGVLMVNYAGHGATNSITNEMLMTSALASQLNMKNLPLWVTASCDISRWDDDESSLGENLLLNSNGGAIALISTVRVVYAQQNLPLNLAIAKNLFNRKADGTRYRLGDIIMAAKQSLASDYNKLNFCLLGDPAMTLSYPDYQMEITDIDYSDITTVRGIVIDPKTGEKAEGFNGLIYPSIFDRADTIIADKGLHQDPAYTFTNRTRKIFTGRDVIKNGEFSFSYITPKDVYGTTEDGLINLYACSENNEEANGYLDNVKIVHPSDSDQDTEGPEITKLYINSSDFKDGETVGSTPYFFAEIHDKSGFNTLGIGIGHDITLTIKNTSNSLANSKQYVLNNNLTTFTGDPTSGNIRFAVPKLADGEYELTFKVWDSFNNSSSRTVHLVVSDKQKPKAIAIQAFPTPAVQGETITFRILHNIPESSTNVRLQIFSQTGIKIYDAIVNNSTSEILYLKENSKEKTNVDTSINADESAEFIGASSVKWKADVMPGIYIYKVYLSSGESEQSTESKLFMVKPE